MSKTYLLKKALNKLQAHLYLENTPTFKKDRLSCPHCRNDIHKNIYMCVVCAESGELDKRDPDNFNYLTQRNHEQCKT